MFKSIRLDPLLPLYPGTHNSHKSTRLIHQVGASRPNQPKEPSCRQNLPLAARHIHSALLCREQPRSETEQTEDISGRFDKQYSSISL